MKLIIDIPNYKLDEEPRVMPNEVKKSNNDLCEICKKGDDCKYSTKTFLYCFTSSCNEYEVKEGDEE